MERSSLYALKMTKMVMKGNFRLCSTNFYGEGSCTAA